MAFVAIGDSWWQLFTAVVLAVVFTQLAFIGHDAGHQQIFRSKRANDVIGYAARRARRAELRRVDRKHNAHHANPNHEDDDPDLDIPTLAFTAGQARAKRGFHRWFAKHQALLFFPLLLLEGLNLHLSAVASLCDGACPPSSRRRCSSSTSPAT